MLTITNRTKHADLTFDQYLALPGKSNSFFKSNINGVMPEFEPTEKMKLGSAVDSLLTASLASKEIDCDLSTLREAKSIADAIRRKFGHILDKCEKQVAYSADVTCGEFTLRCKTLIDFLLPNHATIELKVTDSRDVEALIAFMGYDRQCFLERTLAGVSKSYLLIYSTSLNSAVMLDRACLGCDGWLIDKVYEYGLVGVK